METELDYNRYLVIKTSDIEKYISENDQITLGEIVREIQAGRMVDGKRNKKYVVISESSEHFVAAEVMARSGI